MVGIRFELNFKLEDRQMYETKEERLLQALVTAKKMSLTPKGTVEHFTEMVDYDEAVELIAQAISASRGKGKA